ncbi:MAG: PIG-L family deacetylase [Candidatus Saccharibacteria bacterium]
MTDRRPPRPIHYSVSHIKPTHVTPRTGTPGPDVPRRTRGLRLETATAKSWFSLAACAAVLLMTLTFAYGTSSPRWHTAAPALKLATTTKTPHRRVAPAKAPAAPAAVAADPSNPCAAGSVLTTVAHEDDDILFMNPDLQQEITAGMCIRTVYLTAGDDGQPVGYWQEREQGPDAAYALMAGLPDQWDHATADVGGHALDIHTLVGRPQISLVFMHLPDGNLAGEGFPSTGYQSLKKLRVGEITDMHTIDNTDDYTASQLVQELAALIALAKPTIVNTQASSPSLAAGDHSDHQAVGYFTGEALALYHDTAQVHRYIGYQSGTRAPNLTAQQAAAKQDIFAAYKQDDLMICSVKDGCFNDTTYRNYLSREYQQTAADN